MSTETIYYPHGVEDFYVDLRRTCITCDVWKWSGSNDYKEGTYKRVGYQTFVVWDTPKMPKSADEIIKMWNHSHNKSGSLIRYEATEVGTYCGGKNMDNLPDNYFGKDLDASFKDKLFEIKPANLTV